MDENDFPPPLREAFKRMVNAHFDANSDEIADIDTEGAEAEFFELLEPLLAKPAGRDAADRSEDFMIGMAHGVDALNEARGFDTSPPPFCDQCHGYHFGACPESGGGWEDEDADEGADASIEAGALGHGRTA